MQIKTISINPNVAELIIRPLPKDGVYFLTFFKLDKKRVYLPHVS